jgi:hypothetical protein
MSDTKSDANHDLVVLGLVVRVIFGAARAGRHQQSVDPDAAEPSTGHGPE